MTPAKGIEYLQCLPTDEPVFMLRAQDAYAPATVRAWAAMCLQQYNDPKQDDASAPARAKGRKAQAPVDELRRWQTEHGCKVPD